MLGNSFLKKFSSAFFLLVLIILTLVLSSCGTYIPKPKDADYFKGTYGFEITFLEETPPNEIYEESPFNINIFVENRGAFDVVEEHYGILSIGFDPFYVDASELASAKGLEVTKDSIVFKGVQLPGKSKYHPLGSESFLSFSNFKTKSIKGQREQPSTQVFASLCYPYTTQLSELVCVDFNIYGQNLRPQTCSQQDLQLSDQGAPLAVTRVEVDNQPVANVTRPIFTIHIQNKGSGSVLSPASTSMDFERVCSFKNLDKEDFNTVDVRAVLSHSKELECSPNPIRLFNGQGFTRCQIRDEDLIIGNQNYETPLTVNLSYVYLTSISKEVEIQRLNIYGGIGEPSTGCLPYQIQVGGECKTKCDACADNPGICQLENAKYPILFQKGFACQCSASTCEKLYPKGLCVPFANYCPGASFCCLPECKSNEIRDESTGKCYPKCSKCSEAKKECVCGSEEYGYLIMEEGKFCCTEYKSAHDTKEECDDACSGQEEEF